MNRRQLSSLVAERAALGELIAEMPVDNVIDRGGLLARAEQLDSEIRNSQLEREPARTTLTFRGQPVVGSHGIFADFATKALYSFSEAVAAVAASLSGPLRAMGPIPDRSQNQLLITSTAIGSFGFELEARSSETLFDAEAPVVEQALEKTQALLSATVESDDEGLADSVAELDRRAVSKVRAFVNTLVEGDALCSIEYKHRRFSFESREQTRISVGRMSDENVQETMEVFEGVFEGAMPNKRRTFEFRVRGSADVIVGRFGPEVADPHEIAANIGQECAIEVQVTHVGTGRPRYVLVRMPDWRHAPALG
jgi:hypothetical protein